MSRSSRSMSTRPRSTSLASSHRTMAATDPSVPGQESLLGRPEFPVEREDQNMCVKIEHLHSSEQRSSKGHLEP